jgi:pyruvate formate-lyase activating enzyme-like uncharacterized protein
MIPINRYFSYNLHELPLGCRYCVRGEKLVIFITGICPRKCYFCPVSDQKYQHDVIFANERKVFSVDDVLAEAKQMQAKGAGITGGDPLSKLDRTIEYIKRLKQEFGKSFHIHLYTSLDLVTEETLSKLYTAGLDEIRFHLDLEDKKLWEKLALVKKHSWSVGVEIPLIPNKEKETFELLEFVKDKVDFLNLNELEVADNSQSKLSELGFQTKDQLSYGITGSLELGLKLLELAQKKNYTLPMHLCTAKLKDAVQLSNRIKREAENAKRAFDLVDEEGLLTRGALYLPELAPGFGYREKLQKADLTSLVQKLIPLRERVKKELRLSDVDIIIDEVKPRLLLAKKHMKQNRKLFQKLGLVAAIVTEYPTADSMEVEVEML